MEEHEESVRSYLKTLRDAGLSLTEVKLAGKRAMTDPAYLNRHDPLHGHVKAMVEAATRLEIAHETGRQLASEANQAAQIRRMTEGPFPPGYVTGTGAGVAYRRRSLLRDYGPKPGKDTASYRESLSPAIRSVIEEEFGSEPRDKDPD